MLLGILALSLTFAALAQKVDLDRFNFQFTMRLLPSTPLPEGYNTYNINVAAASSIREVYNDDLVKSNLEIEGLKKTDKQGHITITVNMGDVSLRDPQLKEREEIIKDKDGKETGRRKYYWMEATYSWSANASVADYKGNNLYKTTFANGEANTWKGEENENRSSVSDYYNNNRYSIRGGLSSKLATGVVSSLKNELNTLYGYRTYNGYDFLWIMDSKKHPENDGMKNAWVQFKSTIALMNERDSLTVIKEKLIPVITYFDSLKVRYTGTEKADKKLRYSAYYCLAKIYLLLDNPDAAIKEAELLIANDYDSGDGKYLKRVAEEIKASFEKNKIHSRHFVIDISKYTPPSFD